MSKKGCLISILIVVIIVVISSTCLGLCYLTSEMSSKVSQFESNQITQGKVLKKGSSDKIAVVRIDGVIVDNADETNIFSGGNVASSRKIVKYLDQAEKDGVKAVVLNMNTPGGDVYASDVIYNKLMNLKAKNIRVITVMRGTAASGGYYIAASSDKILANQLTITGSIGVYAEFTSMQDLYSKLGIKVRTITNSGGDYKTGQGLFDDDPNGVEDKIYQAVVDEAYNRFVEIVANGRKMKKEEVKKLADGRIYTGEQAKKLGLIDDFGSYEDAIQLAEKEAGISDSTVIEYNENSFWSIFSGYITQIIKPVAFLNGAVDQTPGLKLKYIYIQ